MDLAAGRAEDPGSPSPASPTAAWPSPHSAALYAWPPAAGRRPEVRPGRRLLSRKPDFLLFLSAPLPGATARERGARERGAGLGEHGVSLLEGLADSFRYGTGPGAGETEAWVAPRRRQGHAGGEVCLCFSSPVPVGPEDQSCKEGKGWDRWIGAGDC